jgi:transmembrane sensor
MNDVRPVSARILDEAIAWQLNLGAGDDDGQQQAFAHWHAAHPDNARAWAQLGGIDQQLHGASTGPARRALQRSEGEVRRRLRRLGGTTLGLLLMLGLALGLLQQRPLSDWLADEVTASGEQRDVELPDHTRIRLNSRSALDVAFDARERRVILRSGEVLVETAHGDQRPFIVQTADGDLRALGTRFLVRREKDGTRLIVLKSAVAAHPARGDEERIIGEGQQVLMRNAWLGASQPAPVAADAWSRGMLVVEEMPLGQLLEQLGEYRRGHLGLDPRLENLRITGSFPLNDSDLALAALPPSLPVSIERHTDWWVKVVPAASKTQ